MKLDNIYQIAQEKSEAQKKVDELNKKYIENLYLYLQDYFEGAIPRNLPINKNQFISINSDSFKLVEGQYGKFFWTAYGHVTTVKDGKVTYGHSKKVIHQGEYEAMAENLRKNTVENAQLVSTSIFPIIPKAYNGTEYANYGYVLEKNTELGLLLVWRKAGTAYIDRMTKSVAGESSLEVIRERKSNVSENIIKIKELGARPDITEQSKKILRYFDNSNSNHTSIEDGGRLNKKIILKNADVISDIFGPNAVNNIIGKIDQQANKIKTIKTAEVAVIEKKKEDPVENVNTKQIIIINGKKIVI